jgi:hypothetical protein
MTNQLKRNVKHYNGLKTLLLAGGLTAAVLGTRTIVLQERPTYPQEAALAQPTNSGPGFNPSALRPIPTVIKPELALPTPAPTALAKPGGGANPPVPVSAGPGSGAPTGGAAPVGGSSSVIPAVVEVGPLPQLPSAGGGGGGRGGGGGGGHSS